MQQIPSSVKTNEGVLKEEEEQWKQGKIIRKGHNKNSVNLSWECTSANHWQNQSKKKKKRLSQMTDQMVQENNSIWTV